VDDGPAALDFYRRAFCAEVRLQLDMPGGGLGHAELVIGDSVVMLASEFPEMGAVSPRTLGGTAASFMIYTDDADAMFARAVECGASVEREVQDQFCGDRSGTLSDPFGHRWSIATHIEDVTEDELNNRMAGFAQDSDSVG